MAYYRRQTAQLATISELKDGSFQQAKDVLAGGVITDRGLVSRVNILGVIVEKQSENSLVLDDGTTSMTCRRFDEMEIDADVGDLVLVIGKPREYNGERYLVLEICKRLANKNWVAYRKKELERLLNTTSVELPPSTSSESPAEQLIVRIREADSGQGADVQEIVSSMKNGEMILKTLLEEGEVFEVRPGKVKVLE